VHPRLILKPTETERMTDRYATAMHAVQHALKWQAEPDNAALLTFANTRYIDRATLSEWVAWGVEHMGAQMVIVDHLHHMQHGAGRNPVEELTATLHHAKDLACRHHLTVLAFSQVKRTGGDATKLYTPPTAEDAGGSSAIERTADVMLGAWRPLRSDLSVEDMRKMQAAQRAGASGEDKIYQEGVMGVRLLKDRLGDAPGKQCTLSVEHGRITALAERDKYTTIPGNRGQA
jgi:hypothetical protein